MPAPEPTPTAAAGRRATAIATIVVTGFLGAGKSTLVRALLAQRPECERWAVLVNEVNPLADALQPVDASFATAGGCACCVGSVAFDVALTRLLRRGPWHRLLVEAPGLGHPARIAARLRGPPFDAHLVLEEVLLVVDACRPTPYLDANSGAGAPAPSALAERARDAALEHLAVASTVIINRHDAIGAGELAALEAALANAPPAPRRVLHGIPALLGDFRRAS